MLKTSKEMFCINDLLEVKLIFLVSIQITPFPSKFEFFIRCVNISFKIINDVKN